MGIRQRLNEKITETRNEAIMLSATLYLTSRKVALVGLGLAALAVDTTGAVANRLEDRGEQVGLALRERIDQALDKESKR